MPATFCKSDRLFPEATDPDSVAERDDNRLQRNSATGTGRGEGPLSTHRCIHSAEPKVALNKLGNRPEVA